MDLPAFENMQACNNAFGEVALKIHPEIGGKQYRDLYAQAKDALTAMRRGCASDVDPDTLKLPELLICCGERDSLVAAYMGYHPV